MKLTQTAKFLKTITPEAKKMILDNIANHYGITIGEAEKEVCDPEAEYLLDYVTGNMRVATSVLMQKYGFR